MSILEALDASEASKGACSSRSPDMIPMLQLRNHKKVIEVITEEVGTWKSMVYTFG